ncbi:MAG: hypothetical protein ACREAN_01865, partial [Nitrosopumilaceae archaeon]
LRSILDTLQKGKPLDDSDQNYLQELVKKSELDDLSIPSPSSEPAANLNTPEEKVPSPENSVDSFPQETKDFISNSPSRKRVVTLAAIIAIVVVAYVGLDAYAVTTLQFRPHHGNQYLISQTQMFIQSDVCNPSYFPASFNKYEINAFYKTDSIEVAEISGSTISPKTYEILNGVFTLNKDTVVKLQQENFTFDPNQAHVTTTVDAPIFGVIPFSVAKEYSGTEFQQVVKNGPPGSFNCG